MDRTEFIVAMAAVLFLAMAFGWFMHWLVHRFIRVKGSGMDRIDRMAKELHEAEERRDRAVENMNSREAELTGELNEAKAEARAALDSLRDLRSEADGLRAYIERVNQAR